MNKITQSPRFQAGAAFAMLAPLIIISACIGGRVSPYGKEVIEALHVVPKAALPAARSGDILDSMYSDSSSDPFLDQTYVVRGEDFFDLTVLNSAKVDVRTLQLTGSQLHIVNGLNDINSLQVIVEVKDLSKLRSITINGSAPLYPADFQVGTPTIPSGEPLASGDRLPGAYAIVTVGALPAGTSIPLEVFVDGDCDLMTHFDTTGKAYCEKTLVNSEPNGTTVVIDHKGCKPVPSPTPSNTPSPSPTPSNTPSPSPTPSDTPSPSPTPSDTPSPSPSPSQTPTGCTRTIGYWKTHSGSRRNQPDDITPLLPQWLGTAGGTKSVQVTIAYDTVASTLDAVTILDRDNDSSNGLFRLMAQLLATRLNIASGASYAEIEGTLIEADTFLAAHDASIWSSLSSIDKQHVNDWKDILDQYNNGKIKNGPPHCD